MCRVGVAFFFLGENSKAARLVLIMVSGGGSESEQGKTRVEHPAGCTLHM